MAKSIIYCLCSIAPPVVTVTPPTIDLLVGGSVDLACATEGEPEPGIVWRVPDGSSADKSSLVTSTGSLPITGAMATDGGTYTCVATNELGSDNSTSVVTIRGK